MPFPYRFRRLTAAQTRAIAAARAAGVPAQSLAREYGVDVRTIHRTIQRAAEPVATVEVADWRTTYALTDEGPVQTEPWRPRA
jgi:DNA-directed RNA polymerase specialized sigma24 family protein